MGKYQSTITLGLTPVSLQSLVDWQIKKSTTDTASVHLSYTCDNQGTREKGANLIKLGEIEATTIGHPDPAPPVPSLTVLSFNDSGDNLQIHFSKTKTKRLQSALDEIRDGYCTLGTTFRNQECALHTVFKQST